jgi:hypothetical protein
MLWREWGAARTLGYHCDTIASHNPYEGHGTLCNRCQIDLLTRLTRQLD